MKRFLITLLRACMFGVTTLLLISACIMVVHGAINGAVATAVIMSLVLVLLCVILSYFATRVAKYTDKNTCKEVFKDVTGLKRKHIIVLLLIQTLLFVATVLTNYSSCFSYNEKYPDAEEYLYENFNVTTSSLILVKSMPTWFSSESYIGAQALYEATTLEQDSDANTHDLDDQIIAIADEMDANIDELLVQKIAGLTFAFLFGLAYTYSKRCQQYHSAMRALEKEKK